MKAPSAGGGWPAILYTLKKSRQAGGLLRMYRALRTNNACKTCALGMGGQQGGMVNEAGRFPEVCKKSLQAMAADMQGAVRERFFEEFSLDAMRRMTPRELETAGRITTPLAAGPLDSHYRRISWNEALDRVAGALRATTPDESFFYFSGRSSNEAGYLMQLMARVYGTNNVSNCSYYCHQASGVGLGSVTGSGTATVVLDDVDGADVLFVIGANPASNHPRFMRTIVDLKRRGGRVVVINPLRELGLVRFKVPSDVRSLLFGSSIADEYVQPHIGGDLAFLIALIKRLVELEAIDRDFVTAHADGWDEVEAGARAYGWDDLVALCGVPRETIDRIADMYASAKTAVFAWAMGVTHQPHGVETVQAIGNLAIARGMVGRPHCGLLPLRGHSNVQGVGSMGVVPKLKPGIASAIEREFDITLPETSGVDTLQALERAHAGGVRFASCLGGNLFGASPDAVWCAEAFGAIDHVVHMSTTLNTSHVWGRGRETTILPVLARDEEDQSTTQESMFNFVRLSDGGSARYEGPRSEVDVICDLASRVLDDSVDWEALRDHDRIRGAIARTIPGYAAIADIGSSKREFQLDGRTFHEPKFATESGRARCHAVEPPPLRGTAEGELRLMTMRSEGQFNTVVYEEEDLYRGQERRDVILMNAEDIARMGLEIDQRVTVRGEAGSLPGVRVRAFDIRAGNAAMYFPEANALIARRIDESSRTPAYKNVVVRVEPFDGEVERSEHAAMLAGVVIDRRGLEAC